MIGVFVLMLGLGLAVQANDQKIFLVTVNYNQPVEQAIAAGKYDWVDHNVTEKTFPSTRTGTADVEMVLVSFSYDVESEDVLRELDKMGLRPAELRELLAFGATYPERQRKLSIIALGSAWQYPYGIRRVPYLCGSMSRRRLRLDVLGGEWYEGYRFAAVRK